jgi:hypothetical protein
MTSWSPSPPGAERALLAARIGALAALVGAGCVKEQSFPEAMKIVCQADRGELSGLPDRVNNREARELIAAATSEPRHRYPARVDRAARRAGVERCGMLEWLGPVLPFDPPSAVVAVDGGGVVIGPLLAIGPDGLQLDGRPVVPVELVAALESWTAPAPGRGSPRLQSISVGPAGAEKEMTLLVAPTTSYRVVFEAIVSATEAGWARFHIMVASPGGSLGSMLLRLPQRVSAAALEQPGETQPLGLIISVTEGRLRLWSLSGLAGTLDAPRLSLSIAAGGAAPAFDSARLNADLAALAEARWPGGSPPAAERQIILQANPETPFQTVVDLMVAARAHRDGRELFSQPVFGRWAFN